MRGLAALIGATQRDARPGYAGAANDALIEIGEASGNDDWIAVAQVFATLAVAEAIDDLARAYAERNP